VRKHLNIPQIPSLSHPSHLDQIETPKVIPPLFEDRFKQYVKDMKQEMKNEK